ncbi:MAG: PAS-domain containing protein [Tranquillimonas sp.]
MAVHDMLLIVSTSLVGALLALAVLFRTASARQMPGILATPDETRVAFVFDGDVLVDATEAARFYLTGAGPRESELEQVVETFSPRFPDLRGALAGRDLTQGADLTAEDGDAFLRLVRSEQGTLRMTLHGHGTDEEPCATDRHHLAALRRELTMLRAITQAAPCAAWSEDQTGRINWVNHAYLRLAERHSPDRAGSWPPARVFPPLPATEARQVLRRDLPDPARPAGTASFDLHVSPIEGGRLVAAVDVTREVRAERDLGDFVQTLARTFADLALGLAIFGKDRRLLLFNPALVALTGLRPEQLAQRPALADFLNDLREQRRVPERRDFAEWRQRLAEMDSRSAGTLDETWHLTDGRSYRVTGLAQPDGALALLFNDVTSQVSAARRFRSEIETGQAVLDNLDEAVAVFGGGRTLVLSNAAYDRLWNVCEAEKVVAGTLADAVGMWLRETRAGGDRAGLECLTCDGDGGLPWRGRLLRHDGQALDCRLLPLPRGMTLAVFRVTDAAAAPVPAPAPVPVPVPMTNGAAAPQRDVGA